MSDFTVANQVVVAGVGYGEVGRDTGKSEGHLTLQAALAAIDDAGLTPADVDGVVGYPDRVSSVFEGPTVTYVQRALGLTESHYWQALGWGPAQLSALVTGVYAIASGGANVVVCYRGHLRQEQRFYVSGQGPGAAVAPNDQAFKSPYGAPAGGPRWALWAQRFLHDTGQREEHMGAVVRTCRTNGQLNPMSVWQGHPISLDDYFASPYVSTPLRLVDCDYPIDGAVALVLARADRSKDLRHCPVFVNSLGHSTGPDPEWDQWPDLSVMATRNTARQLWERSDLKPSDVDVAEVYDGFSFLTLAWLEDLGLCGRGESGDFVLSGKADLGGTLPICTDGGQLGMGRLHGFGKVAEATLQLRGQCGVRQVPDAQVAIASTGGGTLASALLLTKGH